MTRLALYLFLAASLAGFAAAVWSFTAEASGVSGTAGAILVMISTALLIGAGLLVGFVTNLPRWLRLTFETLIALGILGTLFAGWLLMAWALVAAMVVALIGDLIRLFAPAAGAPPRRPLARHTLTRRSPPPRAT